MKEFLQNGVIGALRLTRQGRLKEAVAALQARPAASPETAGSGLGRAFEALGRLKPARLMDGLPGFANKPAACRQPATGPQPGGRFEPGEFRNAAGQRKYKLFVPRSYNGQPLPLLVMLHGCTQSPDDFAAGTRMNEIAERQGLLVLYPAQAGSANLTKCWNWFNPQDQRRDAGEPSIIAGMTRHVMGTFSVRPGQVYVAGISAGGAMATILGRAYRDLYAGVGVHSGLAGGAAHDMGSAIMAMRGGAKTYDDEGAGDSRPVPTILFHGDKDMTVNIANADQVAAQAKGAAVLRDDVVHGEAAGVKYTRTIRSMPDGKAMLEEWMLHGAGHAWSGGSDAGSFTQPGPDASREMLRFFLALQPVANGFS